MAQKAHPNKSDNDTPMDYTDETENPEIIEPERELEGDEDENPVELESEIETLQKGIAEQQDKYLRLAAEFDNYRKRTLREKSELIQTAGESLLKDILPVVDDFERGLDIIDKSEDIKAVKEGIELIYNKVKEYLAANGVKEIKAMNEPFDAEWHEAVTNIPAPSEKMKGKIVDVIQKGYVLNDKKVIRYPKVVVGE